MAESPETSEPVQTAAEVGLSLVLTTVGDLEAGEALVRTLLEEERIACGNLVPGILSLYRWQGAIERQGEILIIMKTGTTEVERLFGRIAELHPYTTPELIELPAGAVAREYQRWVIESIKVSA